MATNVHTLKEFGELIVELAENWDDDEQPYVLVGDPTGNLSITAKDGYTRMGNTGFAQEIFDGNGVHELGDSDWRFYGSVLVGESALGDDMQSRIEEFDGE